MNEEEILEKDKEIEDLEKKIGDLKKNESIYITMIGDLRSEIVNLKERFNRKLRQTSDFISDFFYDYNSTLSMRENLSKNGNLNLEYFEKEVPNILNSYHISFETLKRRLEDLPLIQSIIPEIGSKFDPKLSQIVGDTTNNEKDDFSIVEVIKEGYFFISDKEEANKIVIKKSHVVINYKEKEENEDSE